QTAVNGQDQPEVVSKFPARTLGWLVTNYRTSDPWAELSVATRRQREGFLRAVTESAGQHSLRRIDQQVIKNGIKRRKGPNSKRHFLQTMRGLFQWAKEEGHVEHDPTAGLNVERPETDGYQFGRRMSALPLRLDGHVERASGWLSTCYCTLV